MTQEGIIKAIAGLNSAIASLNARLHPPPDDPGQQQELENELAEAEQSLDILEQALNNLPAPAPDPIFATGAKAVSAHTAAENTAAINLSKAARKVAEDVGALAGESGATDTPAAKTAPESKPPQTKKAGG